MNNYKKGLSFAKGQVMRENQRGEVTRLSILLRLTRNGHFMSIYYWKSYSSLSKDALLVCHKDQG